MAGGRTAVLHCNVVTVVECNNAPVTNRYIRCHFYRATLCWCGISYSHLYIRPSQAAIVSKRMNGSTSFLA